MKILQLQSWMEDYAKGEQGLLTHPIHISRYEREKPYFNESYPFLWDDPLKDGWYNDSSCGCFFVVNNKAYKGDAKMFKYTLDRLCTFEKVGSIDKVEELYLLEKKVYGNPTARTKSLYSASCSHRNSLQMKKAFVQLRKEIRNSRRLNKELTAPNTKKFVGI